ncbi:MAG TPA: carotenoid biosynthesis protein [Actinomycetes bacterium]|nr:carotenoid biosynthesis protein [Actinomycetes bacterium]
MSLRSYTGPAPTVYPSPFTLGFSWVLAVGTIALQIAYPLLDESTQADLAAVTVLVFFLASLVHASACHRWRGFVVVGIVVPAIGWGAERLGSTYGVPFGDYTYTDVLGPSVGGVPVVIPLAWAMMAYPAHVAASTLVWRRWLVPFVTAWALMAWDLFLDPMMVDLGAWRWTTTTPELPGVEGVPLVNFAGWFAVGFLIGIVMLVLRTDRRPFAQPATLFLWVYVSSVLAAAVFFDEPGVAIAGGIAMGVIALPFAWRLWLDRT